MRRVLMRRGLSVLVFTAGCVGLLHGGLKPDPLEIAAGVVLVVVGLKGYRSSAIVSMLVLALVFCSVAAARPNGREHHPAWTDGGAHSGANTYFNWDSAYTRVGHGRLFSTILAVRYHWSVRRHRVWVDAAWIQPNLTGLGSDEGWEYKGSQWRVQQCFRVPGDLRQKWYGQGGCGVAVGVEWQTCYVKCFSEYRVLRSFVYWDGQVAFDNGGS